MRKKTKRLGEKIVNVIELTKGKHYSSWEKIRIVRDGIRVTTVLLSSLAGK